MEGHGTAQESLGAAMIPSSHWGLSSVSIWD